MGTLSLASSGGGTISLAPASSASSATITFPATSGNAILDANFTGTNQQLAGSGYQKLPGGLIIQWGAIANSNNLGGGFNQNSFPVAFTTGVLSMTMQTETSAAGGYGPSFAQTVNGSQTTTNFTWLSYNSTGVIDTTPGARAAFYIAIGY